MIKVHQLAKELGKTAKDIIAKLHELGVAAKNPLSEVSDVSSDDVREAFGADRLAPRPVSQSSSAPAVEQPEVEDETEEQPEAVPPPEPEKPVTPAEVIKAVTKSVEPAVIKTVEDKPVAEPSAVVKETEVAKIEPAEDVTAKAVQVPSELADDDDDSAEEQDVLPKKKYKTIPLDRIKPRRKPAPKEKAPPAVTEKAKPVTKETTRQAPAEVIVEPDSLTDKEVALKGAIVVRDLAAKLGLKPNQVISELMKMNILASITQMVDVTLATKVAEAKGFTVVHEKKATEQHAEQLRRSQEARTEEKQENPDDLEYRSPVVTMLGHVDHGKTSVLDRIRNSSVASGEHGGITQHIGAYQAEVDGKTITFLDTPGHAAFTAMRARGANLTDIAVIIVAADDGIMPQTKEAISHAKAAGVAIMVAINKMDLPQANPERILQQLMAEELMPEEWGGETICCRVSAETGEGIDTLLNMILLQSEVLELKANPSRRAQGYVVEACLEQGRGSTITLLVTTGTLKVGDSIVCGPFWGRVKALVDYKGERLDKAGPSTPVMCLGLSGVPEAGAAFSVVANDRTAKAAAQEEELLLKEMQSSGVRKASLDAIFAQIEAGERRELGVVLKADTQGSVEAIAHALNEINSDKVSLNFVLAGTGTITTNDVMLASASDAVILGFHVAKETGVDALCRREGVDVRLHTVIYEMIDQVREAMTGMLAPVYEESPLGKAQVKQIFGIGKLGTVAGCLVIKGILRASARMRVRRADDTLYEGGISSLKHFQNSVAEVREAQECGIRLDRFNDFEEGDILECYEIREVKQEL